MNRDSKDAHLTPVALVVGGSGGIGSAVGRAFASRGVPVCLTAHNESSRAEGVVACLQAKGAQAFCHKCDLSSEASITSLLGSLNERGWMPCYIIHSASPDLGLSLLRKHEDFEQALLRHLEVGVLGLWRLYRALFALLNQESRLLVVGTEMLLNPKYNHSHQGVYMTAKAAQWGLFLSLADELNAKRGRVAMLCPGMVDTPLVRNLYDERALEIMLESNALKGGLLDADEVGRVLCDLALGDTQWENGEVFTLTLDRGLCALGKKGMSV